MLLPYMRGFSLGTGLLPRSKSMDVSLIGHSKLPAGMSVTVHGCLSCLYPCWLRYGMVT